jgi:hypothetical protein
MGSWLALVSVQETCREEEEAVTPLAAEVSTIPFEEFAMFRSFAISTLRTSLSI